mmetsp:Transcript_21555/g.50684  ORF Transcript_21555/g.50684 Transcript_21555/m.50684 type:complete len:256 (+) Transcript_21555:105-872(+)
MKKETTLSNLLNNKGGLHAGTAVRFAVVTIGSGGIEFHFKGVSRLAELVVHGNLLLIDAIRDVVLIEDNVVGSSLVVDPLDSVSLADSDLGRLEDKKSGVGSHLNLNSLGGVSRGGDSSHAQTGGKAGGLGHGVTARAEVVGHDNSLELAVHVDPVHAHGKRRLDVSLERVDHGGDTSLDGAGAARVSGGALGAREEREKLTLSIDLELKVEVVRLDLGLGLTKALSRDGGGQAGGKNKLHCRGGEEKLMVNLGL